VHLYYEKLLLVQGRWRGVELSNYSYHYKTYSGVVFREDEIG